MFLQFITKHVYSTHTTNCSNTIYYGTAIPLKRESFHESMLLCCSAPIRLSHVIYFNWRVIDGATIYIYIYTMVIMPYDKYVGNNSQLFKLYT